MRDYIMSLGFSEQKPNHFVLDCRDKNCKYEFIELKYKYENKTEITGKIGNKSENLFFDYLNSNYRLNYVLSNIVKKKDPKIKMELYDVQKQLNVLKDRAKNLNNLSYWTRISEAINGINFHTTSRMEIFATTTFPHPTEEDRIEWENSEECKELEENQKQVVELTNYKTYLEGLL